jgi:hypothetical protein
MIIWKRPTKANEVCAVYHSKCGKYQINKVAVKSVRTPYLFHSFYRGKEISKKGDIFSLKDAKQACALFQARETSEG